MSRWNGVEEFLETVDRGSFTAAAKALGVSKSYISKQINSLESRLGVRLMQRTTRQLALTDVGEVFYDGCRKMASQYENTEQLVSTLQERPSGKLKVAINNRYGVRFTAAAIVEFALRYPDITVDVSSSFTPPDLVAEGFDIALQYGHLTDSTLIARKLGSYAMCLCASPDYFEKYGEPRSLDDLRDHSCLVDNSGIWEFDSRKGSIKLKVDGSWKSDDGATLLEAARCGIGLAQLPLFFISDDLQAGRLRRVMGDWSLYDRITWAVYPSHRNLSTRVRVFLDFLTDYFPTHLDPRREMIIAT
ncbi:MAG: LysR family transcriptional regulator [Spongiibacteraceae bacterium]|jgi:DNA-binding transcriptional LysR family regulator|nr:LysR family transcriptional regulator [Spongiibacteraceae bacterium]